MPLYNPSSSSVAAGAALDFYGQSHEPEWYQKEVYIPASSALVANGLSLSISGTATSPGTASTNYRASIPRVAYTSATTAGSVSGIKSSSNSRWTGNAAGLGGFDMVIRFALNLIAGQQASIGMSSGSPLLTGFEPSGASSNIWLAADSTDTNLQWMTRDGTTNTKVDTGVAKTSVDVFRLKILALPNGGAVTASLYDETTAATVSTLSSPATLPSTIVFLGLTAQVRNGATTSASVIEILRMSIDSTPR